jgi:biotin transport system substrate-specific component
MQFTATFEEFDRFKAGIFQKRDDLAFVKQLALSILMAVITGMLAQVRVALPWTPVPITGQVLAVLMAGVMLGGRMGALSQFLYVTLGALGVPWFNGLASGFSVLAGPTGGYIIGFIPASFAVGYLMDSHPSLRTIPGMTVVMGAVTFICIYIPGMINLAFWHRAAGGSFPGPLRTLMMGAVPFLPGEAFKIVCAALSARLLGPPSSGVSDE